MGMVKIIIQLRVILSDIRFRIYAVSHQPLIFWQVQGDTHVSFSNRIFINMHASTHPAIFEIVIKKSHPFTEERAVFVTVVTSEAKGSSQVKGDWELNYKGRKWHSEKPKVKPVNVSKVKTVHLPLRPSGDCCSGFIESSGHTRNQKGYILRTRLTSCIPDHSGTCLGFVKLNGALELSVIRLPSIEILKK